MNTNRVVAGSLAVILGLAGLASGQARAESLTVESGQTVSVAAAATYDSVTVRGALEISGATLTTAARVSLDGGTIRLGDGGVLSAAGIDVGASDSILSFEGGRCLLAGQIKTGGAGKLSIVGAGGDVLLDYNCSSWGYCFRREDYRFGRLQLRDQRQEGTDLPCEQHVCAYDVPYGTDGGLG